MGNGDLFGMGAAELLPIVERMADGPICSFEYAISADMPTEHYGERGDKRVVTFDYVLPSGEARRRRVVVKRTNLGFEEAFHYRYLAGHDAPIPTMYGSQTSADGREVIVLECLDPVFTADDGRSRSRLLGYARAVARFNAITPADEYRKLLTNDFAHREVREAADTMRHVWSHASAGDCGGAAQKTCRDTPGGPGRWEAAACSIRDRMDAMEVGLCHRDPEVHHAGRSPRAGETALYDLSDVGFAARFWDIAVTVHHIPLTALREEVAQCYLSEYTRWGGPVVPARQFLEETQVLCRAQHLRWLGMVFNHWHETRQASLHAGIHGSMRRVFALSDD